MNRICASFGCGLCVIRPLRLVRLMKGNLRERQRIGGGGCRRAQSERAKIVRLKVIKQNDRARRFYERMGFRANGFKEVRERDGLMELQMEVTVP
jgi:hypothetical protein